MAEDAPSYVADEIGPSWVEDFAAEGMASIEDLLEKHAGFRRYLEEHDLP